MGRKGRFKNRVAGSALNSLTKILSTGKKKTGRARYNKRKPADEWAALENNKPVLSSFNAFRQSFQDRLLRKKNPGEKACNALLKHITQKYEREKYVQAGKKFYFIDFFVYSIDGTPVNIALEIDGSIHDKDDVKKNDRIREQYMINIPWVSSILRITSEKVQQMTIGELRDALLGCLRKKVNKLSHKTPAP